jgi:hypothetical protein
MIRWVHQMQYGGMRQQTNFSLLPGSHQELQVKRTWQDLFTENDHTRTRINSETELSELLE